MIVNRQLVVMRKHGLSKHGSGVVSIVFTLNPDTAELDVPSPQEFPTGAVWISGGYDDICQKFDERELFLLVNYDLIDKTSDVYINARAENKHDYWATGGAAKKFDSGYLVPVLDAPMPEIGSGRLDYMGEIPAGPFFIKEQDHVIGPFTVTRTDSDIIATPSSGMALKLQNNHVAKLSCNDLSDNGLYLANHLDDTKTGVVGYIPGLKEIVNRVEGGIEQVDYINDAQLITYFTKNGFGTNKNPLAKKAAEQLKASIAEECKRKNIHGDNKRLNRLTNMLDQYLEKSDLGKEIIEEWISSQAGRDFLEKIVKDNPRYIEINTEELTLQKAKLERDLTDIRADKRRAELEVSAEKARVIEARNQAEKEIEEIRKKTREEQERERRAVLADLEKDIHEKRNELSERQESLDALLVRLEAAGKIKNLKDEVNFYERRKTELDHAIKAQEGALRSPDLPEEAIRTQTIIDLIQGRRLNLKENSTPYYPSVMATSSPENGEGIIEALADKFDEGGRSFTFEEMANLQITIQQSFMTVLKGLPGSGKTSTAIRFAQSHHLADENGQGGNFLNIPACRGWVSSRDFIGFYNSLKGTYQPAKTGLYQFLRQAEEQIAASNTLRLVLLDEGNLSPIEHYMSDFLGLFDVEGRSRPLDTGMVDENRRYLRVSENIRFVTTINNDHTTETLSPRLCDRVPVISMDIQKLSGSQPNAAFDLNGAIPYAKLEEYFGVPVKVGEVSKYAELPPKLAGVLTIFSEQDKSLGQAITVSKRKQIAMQAYYAVASRYMTEVLASDFAVAQYMLPLINGFGKEFRGRLEKIAEYSSRNGLAGATQLLESIMQSGDSHVGNYSFF